MNEEVVGTLRALGDPQARALKDLFASVLRAYALLAARSSRFFSADVRSTRPGTRLDVDRGKKKKKHKLLRNCKSATKITSELSNSYSGRAYNP